jgi:hypothetical protein
MFSGTNRKEATTPFPCPIMFPLNISVDQLSLPQSLPLPLLLSLSLPLSHQPITNQPIIVSNLSLYQPVTCQHVQPVTVHMDHIPRTPHNYISNITNACLYQAYTKITNIPSQDMCLNHVPKHIPNHQPVPYQISTMYLLAQGKTQGSTLQSAPTKP